MSPTTGYAAAIDTNDLVMSYIPEATWGTTPATPNFQSIRFDSEGFSGSKSRTRPNEIDPSGQASAAITTKQEAQGSLNWSVSPSIAQNELLAASIGSAGWSGELIKSVATTNAVISSANTTLKTCTVTVTGALFTSTDIVYVGQYLKFAVVMAGGTQNFIGKIKTVSSATALDLEDCYGDYTNGTSSGGATVTSYGAYGVFDGTACTVSSGDSTNKLMTLTVTGATFSAGTKKSHKLAVGQFIKIENTNDTTKSCIGRVKTITSDTAIVIDCLSYATADFPSNAAWAGTATVTIKGAFIRNGTTFNSFTFEKKFSSALYLRYAGSFPTGGSLDVGTGDYLKGTMSFLTKSEASATGAIAGAAYNVPPANVVIDSVKGIGTVWRNNDANANAAAANTAPVAGVVQKLGIKWNKEGAAAQYGIGSSAALGIRPGKMTVTGSMSSYFSTFALYNEYLAETTGAISFFALDNPAATTGSKGYVLTLCNATIMNPKIVAGGPSQDVMAEFEVEGNPDNSTASFFGGKTIQIDFFS